MFCISHVDLKSGEFAHINLRFLFLLDFYFYLFVQFLLEILYLRNNVFENMYVHDFLLGIRRAGKLAAV